MQGLLTVGACLPRSQREGAGCVVEGSIVCRQSWACLDETAVAAMGGDHPIGFQLAVGVTGLCVRMAA